VNVNENCEGEVDATWIHETQRKRRRVLAEPHHYLPAQSEGLSSLTYSLTSNSQFSMEEEMAMDTSPNPGDSFFDPQNLSSRQQFRRYGYRISFSRLKLVSFSD